MNTNNRYDQRHLRGECNEVEAIILAAGRGSRLATLTASAPKCMLEVGGTPLIDHQLRMLTMAGISRVSVVVGYQRQEIAEAVRGRARLIENPAWEETNSLYSLSLCTGQVRGPLLIMNCDVLVHPLALQRLLATRGSAFLYDSSSGEADEHMKVELTTGLLSAMRKSLPAHRTFGENVGILHFTAPAAQDLLKAACGLVQNGHHKTWMAAAVEQVARSWPIQGVDIADLPWIEIDFPDDLDRACTHVWPQITGAFAPPALRAAA